MALQTEGCLLTCQENLASSVLVAFPQHCFKEHGAFHISGSELFWDSHKQTPFFSNSASIKSWVLLSMPTNIQIFSNRGICECQCCSMGAASSMCKRDRNTLPLASKCSLHWGIGCSIPSIIGHIFDVGGGVCNGGVLNPGPQPSTLVW